MLIRTQDKTEIINMDRLTFIGADEASFDGKNTIGIFVTDNLVSRGGFLIGKYSTIEKSETVLDMIEEAYKMATDESLMQRMNDKMVFQMPQNEEVPDA